MVNNYSTYIKVGKTKRKDVTVHNNFKTWKNKTKRHLTSANPQKNGKTVYYKTKGGGAVSCIVSIGYGVTVHCNFKKVIFYKSVEKQNQTALNFPKTKKTKRCVFCVEMAYGKTICYKKLGCWGGGAVSLYCLYWIGTDIKVSSIVSQ